MLCAFLLAQYILSAVSHNGSSQTGRLQFSSIVTAINIDKDSTEDRIQKMIKYNCVITATNIIENEFFGEYGKIFYNLKNVIQKFTGSNQLMTFSELYQILNNTETRIKEYSGKQIEKPYEIFERLYELGFIGIRATEEFMDQCNALHKDIMYFSERFVPLAYIGSDEFEKCEFFINPIFTDYLQLKINSPDLICDYPWDYLHDIENKIEELFYHPQEQIDNYLIET